MMNTTAISPTMPMMEFKMVISRVWKLEEEENPGQPEAFLASSEASLLQMLVVLLSSAKTGRELVMPKPNRLAMSDKVNKIVLDNFMNLLFCDSFVNIIGITAGFVVGIANHVADKSGDNLGKGDNGETDEGVENHTFGFLKFAYVTGRSDVGDTAVDDENGGNGTSDADDPLDEVYDHLVGVDATGISDCVFVDGYAFVDISRTGKGDANCSHDDVGRHNNGETDKGAS